MITKEQAMTADNFIQVYMPLEGYSDKVAVKVNRFKLPKPDKWQRNGRTKTWKTRQDDFKIPVKHGLYSYGYIDNTNAHLFEVDQ